MRVTGVLATHYHADHVGGSMMGYAIEGIAALLEHVDCPIHVQRDEVPWVRRTTGCRRRPSRRPRRRRHREGRRRSRSRWCTRPGHTPGSQCFHVDGRLVSGDTLFLDGCGRTDLPGSNPEEMYDSLQKLAAMPDDTVVYPGPPLLAPVAAPRWSRSRDSNYVFRPRSAEQWLQMFGG